MFCAGQFFTAMPLQAKLAAAGCALRASTANAHLATKDAVTARILLACCWTLFVCINKASRVFPDCVRMKWYKGSVLGSTESSQRGSNSNFPTS